MPVHSVHDWERLDGVLAGQFGVISRAQVIECGVGRGRLDHLVRPGGRWQRILPGVYAAHNGAPSADQRAMAALLYAGPRSMLTGAVAVRRHRLRCPGLNQVDVLVPDVVRVQSAGYVRIVRTGRMPEKLFRTRQIRFAPLDRAIADAARRMVSLGDVRAVVAEAVQSGGCDLASLVAELKEGPVSGSRLYRMALREAGVGSRSAAEGDFMTLIGRSDLPEPIYNADLYTTDGAFLGIADAWWQRAGVVGEVDSRQYHLSPRDYEHTVMRHNRMAASGINILHFLPSTIKASPSTVIANLRGAIKSGTAQPPLPIVAKPSTPSSAPSL